MTDISSHIAGNYLPVCLWNAAGPLCTTKEELINLSQCPFTGAVTTKSCTLEERKGNPEPRYVEVDLGTINSMGLPNLGYKFYSNIASELNNKMNPKGKPIFVSVSGQSLEDNIKMIQHFNGNPHVSAIELNLSCPNVIGHPQVGYDFEQATQVLSAVSDICTEKPLGVKLPPYFDLVHFERMARIITDSSDQVKFITCINSIGNGLIVDPETESAVIKPKGGLGGIGGEFVKPTALANVYKFRQLLPNRIDIIGCGGVCNGIDVFEHILVGASGVQIGSQLSMEGVDCFQRISNELRDVMRRKGYTSLDQFRGKLKTL